MSFLSKVHAHEGHPFTIVSGKPITKTVETLPNQKTADVYHVDQPVPEIKWLEYLIFADPLEIWRYRARGESADGQSFSGVQRWNCATGAFDWEPYGLDPVLRKKAKAWVNKLEKAVDDEETKAVVKRQQERKHSVE